jgi:hypothetical protein
MNDKDYLILILQLGIDVSHFYLSVLDLIDVQIVPYLRHKSSVSYCKDSIHVKITSRFR